MGKALSKVVFRKTRSGDWAVFGPAELIEPGDVVVEKRDGSTTVVTVERCSKTFEVDGVEHCFGYIVQQRYRPRRRRSKWCECGYGADMMSIGYRAGDRARCPNCGGIAEAG